MESDIQLQPTDEGSTLSSTTYRGKMNLKLVSRFDADQRLLGARVTVSTGDRSQSAVVEVDDGKARVSRDDGSVTVLDCPAGVIVTSAPDWTDAFMLMNRYDARRGGPQAACDGV